MVGGRRVEMGLGAYPEVGLGTARTLAAEKKLQIGAGIDPTVARRQARQRLIETQRRRVTFNWCAEQYIATQRNRWSNEKHQKQWSSTLATYASPVFGSRPVAEIDRSLVLEVLRPIWHEKTETASRVRGRIESVLAWATANGYRSGDNPAAKDLLRVDLPAPREIASVKHHLALPYQALPAAFARIGQSKGVSARCLRFLILTAVRSGDTRGALWSEFDLEKRVWTIPNDRIKRGISLVVPLSEPALTLLRAQRGIHPRLVFPSPTGGVLSDMAMTAVLRGLQLPCVPHGFRTTFRVWAAEQTQYPREVCEFALAHQLKDKVEAAYNRSNLLDKRRPLMDDWAEFCTGAAALR
jgi:integrase